MKKFSLIALISVLAFSIVNAAILTTSVSQKKLSGGEAFNLIIDVQNAKSNLQSPDLTPLQKNFMILGTAQNQSLTVINNKITRSSQWIINLIPKKTGTLLIPSIYVGANKTQPISINVENLQTVKENGQQTIFLEVTIQPKQPYVNSELVYQLRVYYNVNVNSASIIPPQANDTLIQQSGQDQIYQTTIKNKKYQVYQRNFILIPQKSGELALSPAIFRGQITNNSPNPAFANFYNLNTQPVELIAPIIKIKVKPIPESFSNDWWLPASQVKFSEQWSQATNKIKIGKIKIGKIKIGKIKIGTPITRTITLTATGALASQLPPLTSNNTEMYNSYGSQPKLENSIVNGHLVGKKQEKFVYIPTQAGNFTLPALSIKWWNVETQKLEMTVLPAKTFHTLAAGPIKTIENSSLINPITNNKIAQLKKTSQPKIKGQYIDWMSVTALFIGFLFLILSLILILRVWWCLNHRKKSNNISLKKACLSNDAVAAKVALLAWAQQKFREYNGPQNLNAIRERISCPEFVHEIELLQEKLYGDSKKNWSGEKLWHYVKNYKAPKDKHSSNKNSLPDLNPK